MCLITPGGWQISPLAGYNYTGGNQLTEIKHSPLPFNSFNSENFILTPSSNHGTYLGILTLKSLTASISIVGFTGDMAGSGNYRGYLVGGGLSYKINKRQSFNVFAILSDDDYGQRNKRAVSYSYQFN